MTEAPVIIVNGVPQTALSISVFDRGLAYGDGVFETLWLQNGELPLWQYHQQRLFAGLERLSISVEQTLLRQHIEQTLQQFSQSTGVLKLIVTRGIGGRGYMPPEEAQALLVSSFHPISDEQANTNRVYAQQGVAVHYCQQRLPTNPSLAGIKSLNQLNYVLASHERQSLPVQEGILFSEDDCVIEATARNIFLVKDGQLLTPLLSRCGVDGVMRRVIIDNIAQALAIPVKQTDLSRADLLAADEVFLSNSITRIWPVIRAQEQCWPVGPVTQSIQAAIDDFLQNQKTLSYSKVL